MIRPCTTTEHTPARHGCRSTVCAPLFKHSSKGPIATGTTKRAENHGLLERVCRRIERRTSGNEEHQPASRMQGAQGRPSEVYDGTPQREPARRVPTCGRTAVSRPAGCCGE